MKCLSRVYFVSAPGRIKIGYTRNPEKRLLQLQASDVEILRPLGAIVGTRSLEQSLHKKLHRFRIRGEWFLDCEQVRTVIEQAIAGSLPIEINEDDVAQARSNARSGLDAAYTGALTASLAEARSIASLIEARIGRGENISDLVRSACFLAEKVIAPILSHSAPEIGGK